MTQMRKGYLAALIAVLIWSGFIIVSRMGGVSGLSAYDVMAIRYFTCASVLLPIWGFKYRFNMFKARFIVVSLIGGLAYALCTFRGFQLSSASHASLLLPGLIPLFIIVLSAVINREAQTKLKWLGIGAITLGVAALFSQQLSVVQGVSEGDLWFVAGSFCWALFSILIKRWGITPWQATVSLAVITCTLYLPVYVLWLPKTLSNALWSDIFLQVFYQGFLATIIQMIFYVKAVQYIGPSSMGAMMAIVPVLSGVSAILIFDEPATPTLLISLTLVSLGAWIAHSAVFQDSQRVQQRLDISKLPTIPPKKLKARTV
ncbi:MAG: DMT family transporter [Pseudomonadales bacterium]|nr:DMT family transporter [Pseudomonadales bacterium]